MELVAIDFISSSNQDRLNDQLSQLVENGCVRVKDLYFLKHFKKTDIF